MDRIKKIKIKQQDGTMSDYYPIGADASNVDIDYNNSTLEVTMKKTPRYYENVASMKLDDTLQEGDMTITLGYYTANDGGGAEYKIKTSSESYCEELNNELVAELIIKDEIDIAVFGAERNTDISTLLNNLLQSYDIINISYNYNINSSIIVPLGKILKGKGTLNTYASTAFILNKNVKIIDLNIVNKDSNIIFTLSNTARYDVNINIKNINFTDTCSHGYTVHEITSELGICDYNVIDGTYNASYTENSYFAKLYSYASWVNDCKFINVWVYAFEYGIFFAPSWEDIDTYTGVNQGMHGHHILGCSFQAKTSGSIGSWGMYVHEHVGLKMTNCMFWDYSSIDDHRSILLNKKAVDNRNSTIDTPDMDTTNVALYDNGTLIKNLWKYQNVLNVLQPVDGSLKNIPPIVATNLKYQDNNGAKYRLLFTKDLLADAYVMFFLATTVGIHLIKVYKDKVIVSNDFPMRTYRFGKIGTSYYLYRPDGQVLGNIGRIISVPILTNSVIQYGDGWSSTVNSYIMSLSDERYNINKNFVSLEGTIEKLPMEYEPIILKQGNYAYTLKIDENEQLTWDRQQVLW